MQAWTPNKPVVDGVSTLEARMVDSILKNIMKSVDSEKKIK